MPQTSTDNHNRYHRSSPRDYHQSDAHPSHKPSNRNRLHFWTNAPIAHQSHTVDKVENGTKECFPPKKKAQAFQPWTATQTYTRSRPLINTLTIADGLRPSNGTRFEKSTDKLESMDESTSSFPFLSCRLATGNGNGKTFLRSVQFTLHAAFR